MNKKQQEEQRRQEDLALMQGLLWVAGAVVLEVLLFFINRYAFDFDATMQGVTLAETVRGLLGVMRWAGLAAFVGGGIMLGLKLNKGGKTVWAAVAAVVGVVILTCAHVALKYQSTGMRMLYLLVPVLGGLALSYFIYQRDFFLAALPGVAAVLGLWFVRVSGVGLEALVTMLVCVVVLIAALKLKKDGGVLKLGEKSLRILPEKADCAVVLISGVIAVAVQAVAAVAVLAVSAAVGSALAYYLIFAMGAWLFALLVYHTVKML